jgi:hypothetical protein
LVWLVLLSFATSFFWFSPLIPWTMIALTVVSSVYLWHRLLLARSPALPIRALAAAAAGGPR